MLKKQNNFFGNNGWKLYNNKWIKNGVTLTITLTVNSSNSRRVLVAKNIKEQLENIGVVMYLKEVSDNEYNNCLKNKNYQILLTGIYNGYSPDLNYFYGSGNLANYSNDNVSALLNEVLNITDEKILREKYGEIIRITADDCAYICLYRNKCSVVLSRKMSGNFEPNNYTVFNNLESWSKQL